MKERSREGGMDGGKDEGRGKEAEERRKEGRKERERGGIFCTRSLAPSPHQTDPTDNDEHFSVATGHSHGGQRQQMSLPLQH